jgi:acetylornithine deacetylase/succinyl-diaminopimelate desuccinylase-like protein
VEAVVKWIDEGQERALRILTELLRIPSVSTDPEHREDMKRASEYLADLVRGAGIENVEIVPTEGHPIVYGEKLDVPGAPTLLVYGHYDVQPVGDLAKWSTAPFEPQVRDGKIWARGATDDKGQLLIHVFAAEAHLRTHGKLPVNVKYVFEGEEEIGSSNLKRFLEDNRQKLACDAVIISDTSMFGPGVPSLCTGLRGIAYVEFTLRGPASDLHSGSFGGAVANPALVLAQVLTRMKGPESGRVLIEGFYDDVVEPAEAEKRAWANLPQTDEEFRRKVGVPELHGEANRTTLERLWSRPSLDVNGIWGGFTGEGSMTVLPARASAKVSMRLVPEQDPKDIVRKFRAHLEKTLPGTVVLETFKEHHGAQAWTCSVDQPVVQAALRAVEKGFGAPAVPTREGGSIPIVHDFSQILGVPVVLMGIGLNDEGAHGPDEHLDLGNFQAGIRSAAHLLAEGAAARVGSQKGSS